MGQGCSGSVADALSEVHGQETGLSSTVVQIGNGNSKSSTMWRQQNARRIDELIINLNNEEFRALLVSIIVNTWCTKYMERNGLMLSLSFVRLGTVPREM